MQYALLKSIIASQKRPIPPQCTSESFFLKSSPVRPYVEPTFSKVTFPTEKPSLLLVSANGASGKTTTAHSLSFDLQLPILDLAKHKAVGDNTLTGVLTNAYSIDTVGPVLEGLRNGTHAIIIDGIDEGRSKTNDLGFEAFLDDLLGRSKGSPTPAIVVFGRGRAILDTWLHLEEGGAAVGMVQIEPFSIEKARSYIDLYLSNDVLSQHRATYEGARDQLLSRLGLALSSTKSDDDADSDLFLSFIGYPPVLDAIVALLRKERNYHRIEQALGDNSDGILEISLLIRISRYLLDREYREKALPLFIDAIAGDADNVVGDRLRGSLYRAEEQCARVLSHALGRPFTKRLIEDSALNERYEKAVGEWFGGHVFLDSSRLRNVVFASFATCVCALSSVSEYRDLAQVYVKAHTLTYHFLYFMSELARERTIDARFLNALIQSSSDFRGIEANIQSDIDGSSWEETDDQDMTADLVISIGFPERGQERTFSFCGAIETDSIPLGPSLINTTVTVPCIVDLSGAKTLDVTGRCSISALAVRINVPDLLVREIPRVVGRDGQKDSAELFVDAKCVEGHAESVTVRAGKIVVQCESSTVGYPLARHIINVSGLRAQFGDALRREKYRRLRRILSDFASHGKGGLAKFRAKIEHDRVLGGELGRQILDNLLEKEVLTKDVRFYYVEQQRLAEHLGISWQQLRRYESSRKLDKFLSSL